MKVLIINLRIGTGSVGRIVSDLYSGIVAAGNECKIAYGRGDSGIVPANDTYRITSEFEIRVHAGLTRLFGNTGLYSTKSTKDFCKWIDDYDPDIVHIHGAYGYYLNFAELFMYLSKKNIWVVSTLHSCWDFTGHCCYFDYSHCSQWKTGCKQCNQKSSYPKSSFLDNTARNYRIKKKLYSRLNKCVIVSPSKWLANIATKSFLCNKDIRVINNGIDLESFSYNENVPKIIDKSKPVILCVANNWEKRKGWDDVVTLSNIIGNNIQLVVIGVTEQQKKELSKDTIAISRTNSKEELAMYYSHSTVFFNPTYEDNYPTVNLEAAACRLPIVTYNTGGSPEILEYGDWGIVIEKQDYDSLLEYTLKLFDQKIKLDYSKVKQLSNKEMVNKYLNLYSELV